MAILLYLLAAPTVVAVTPSTEGTVAYGPVAAQISPLFFGGDFWLNASTASAVTNFLNTTPIRLLRFYGELDKSNVTNGHTYGSNGVAGPPKYNLQEDAQIAALASGSYTEIGLPAQINSSWLFVHALQYYYAAGLNPWAVGIGVEPNSWTHFNIPYTSWLTTDNVAPTGLQYALEVQRMIALLQPLYPGLRYYVQLSGFMHGNLAVKVRPYVENVSKIDGPNLTAITFDIYPQGITSRSPLTITGDITALTGYLANASAWVAKKCPTACANLRLGISEENLAEQQAGPNLIGSAAAGVAWAAQVAQLLPVGCYYDGYWAASMNGGYGNGWNDSLFNATSGLPQAAGDALKVVRQLPRVSVAWANVSTSLANVYSVEGLNGTAAGLLVVNANTAGSLTLGSIGLKGPYTEYSAGNTSSYTVTTVPSSSSVTIPALSEAVFVGQVPTGGTVANGSGSTPPPGAGGFLFADGPVSYAWSVVLGVVGIGVFIVAFAVEGRQRPRHE